jgi:hypothetical protein
MPIVTEIRVAMAMAMTVLLVKQAYVDRLPLSL